MTSPSIDAALTAAADAFLAAAPDYPKRLEQLAATTPAGLPGIAAQARVLAHLIGADDPDPGEQQLLAKRIRDGLNSREDAIRPKRRRAVRFADKLDADARLANAAYLAFLQLCGPLVGSDAVSDLLERLTNRLEKRCRQFDRLPERSQA